MNNESPSTRTNLDISEQLRIFWFWIAGSGIGAMVGAWLAMVFFPSASMDVYTAGQFGWETMGAVLAISVSFGVSQWLVLRYVARYREIINTTALKFWIPVTIIGFAIMIIPLWSLENYSGFLLAMIISMISPVVFYMLPGMIILGLIQWYVLYRTISGRFVWVIRTIVGAGVGCSFVGVWAGVAFRALVDLVPGAKIPFEAAWALALGISIDVLQGFALVKDLDADLKR